MEKLWVGYDNVAFVSAQLMSHDNYTELFCDASGLPVLANGQKLYVQPGRSDLFREVVQTKMVCGSLQLTSERPPARQTARRAPNGTIEYQTPFACSSEEDFDLVL